MANRFCERPPCGAKMSPWWPRTRMPNGELWCPGCVTNHSRNLATGARVDEPRSALVTEDGMRRVAVRVAQGEISGDASPERRLAHFLAWDQPNIVVVAHDSGDSQTIFHCPFCGSGQVIARSDGTTECEFCHSAFTVQVQPQFAAFPQTIDGVPVDVPGMPSNTELPPGADPDAAIPPEEGGALPGTDGPPGADEEAEEESEEDDDKPAFLKGSYRTSTGSVLHGDSYLRHLAITYGPDREKVLARVRRATG
jgi:hypothetical protein